MACDTDDREGESPSPMEPRLGRTFHSSATGRRREHIFPEAPGLRQAARRGQLAARRDGAPAAGSGRTKDGFYALLGGLACNGVFQLHGNRSRQEIFIELFVDNSLSNMLPFNYEISGASGTGGPMEPRQEPKPEPDGEERDSSPSWSYRAGKQDREGGGGQPSGRPTAAAGFAEDGMADVMDPGSELAGLVTAVTGPDGKLLGTLTEQEILGVLGAVQRLAAWAAWGELVTLAEFARRRLAATAD